MSAWTEERVELLKKLWEEGRSANQIAAALKCGITKNGVIGKVHRLGLPLRSKEARQASARVGQRRHFDNLGVSRAPRERKPPQPRSPAKAKVPERRGSIAMTPDVAAHSGAPTAPVSAVVLPFPQIARLSEPQRGHCQWPIGEPGHPAFGYCGAHAVGTYCADHKAVARGKAAVTGKQLFRQLRRYL